MRPRSPLLVLAALASLATPAAHADEWLTARHDPQRTGASSGSLLIDRPAVVWRRYLGGQLSSPQYFALDVDRDGADEVVYIAGGRAIAKRPNNVIVWESPLLTLSAVVGIADLDMDGNVEVITYSSNRVYALSSLDGHVLWSNPAGPIAEIGAVRVSDLDGDLRPDLYIGECRCCTLRGTANGVAYSFAGGFAGATQMWTLPTGVGGCGADQDQIADVTGDSHSELIVSSLDTEIAIVNAATGVPITRIPNPSGGGFYPGTRVFPVNLDADATLEFVALTNGYLATGDRGARRVIVYDDAGSGFTSLWQADAPDRVNDVVDTVDGAIGDLDGMPGPEIALTFVIAGAPHVEVRNALTGATLAMLPNASLVGAADLDHDGVNELLVNEGSALSAYRFDGTMLAQRWTLPNRSVARRLDHDRLVRDPNSSRTLALDLDGDPSLELIVSGADAMGRATLWALDADVNPPHEIGHFSAPAGITILTTGIGHNFTNPYDQVTVVTSDGYLIVLDRMMVPTNRIAEGEIQLPGMRVGGYYSGPYGIGFTPSIARIPTSSVVVRDSRPALLRLDASTANPSTPPTTVWERGGSAWPVFLDADGDGARDVVVAEGNDVVALDAATARTERWRASSAIPVGGMFGDLLPARRNAAVTDIVFPGALPGAIFAGISVDGASGTIRWNSFTRALQWGYQSYSVGDVTGDGVDDMVSVTNSTMVLNGATGALESDNNTFVAYAMPMLTDADGDGVNDVWVHGGYFPDRLLARDMTDRVVRSDHTTPNTGRYGARVTCGTDAVVVEGAYDSPDLWAVRIRDATPIAHRTLASGDVFDPGMAPSDHPTGLVGNVTSVRDIGTAHPAVLAGSTDGYLYALDPCTLARIWSLDLRYPVGEPVVGDVNNTDPDELVVTCADGFLYGIGRAGYDAPMQVLDVDPMSADPNADVDEIDTVDTLYAKWTAVTGATSYEVGVFSAAGSETRFPNTMTVGNVTSATIDMLPLRQGSRYYVSVRPIGPNGPGIEARSDGVTVTDNLPPTATITVTPMRSWPAAGNSPTVDATCADRVGLSHYAIDIRRADGTVLRSLDDRDYTGSSRTVSMAWDGRDAMGTAMPAGDYVAHVACRDVRLRETTADATFTLDPAATLPTDAGTPMMDAGRDGGSMMTGGAGCACRAAGTSSRSPRGAALILIGLGVVIARRRCRAGGA